MKKLSCILLVAVAGLLTGCWDKQIRSNPNDPLVRYHFAGMKAALQGTNGTRLQKVWALPDSVALREETLTKLARAPFYVLRASLPPGSMDEGILIKPLLDDLVNNEHFLEAKSVSDKLEFVIAVKLPADRSKAWEANLQKLLGNWKLGKPAVMDFSGLSGWEAKGDPGHLGFVRAGDWTVIGLGTVPKLNLMPDFAAKAGKSQTAAGNLDGALLDMNADLPRLGKWVPVFADYPLPPAHLRVQGKGESLRTEIQLRYAENLPWTPEPWVLPKKAINDPLVSFTVAQGLSQFLGESAAVRQLGLKEVPNQFSMWGVQHSFPMTYLAFPAASASNTINQMAQLLPKEASRLMTNHMGEFFWTSNRAEFAWRNLPFIVPRTYPYREGGNQFVMTEIYPRPPLTNPPPPELFAEIQGKSKLLYYDWEVTQERLPQANQLYQLYDIVNNRRPFGTNILAQHWLLSLAPQLGNTVTEITVSTPKEVSLVRKSHVGLTGFELVTLARWVNSKNFPFEFEPAPGLRKRPSNAGNSLPKPGTGAPQRVPAPTKGGK